MTRRNINKEKIIERRNDVKKEDNFKIEIWETDWHRESGESFFYDETFENFDLALKKARKLYEDNQYASIMILSSENVSLYCCDYESEEFYFNENKISFVDKDIFSDYIYNWLNHKEQTFKSDLLYCKDNSIYVAIDNTSGDCWIEEFSSEIAAQHWLLGNDIKLNEEEGLGMKFKGDKVEVSTCSIINDVGGTTTIRNSKYEDIIDGMIVTVENLDGTIGHTILSSHDKLVNLPIEIEVIEGFYDYETGYRYKGKITDERLIEEFKSLGTTGFKPNDCKIYKDKSKYEDVLKASENYDSSIVYFSEFDVVKILDKNFEKGVEI